LGCAFTRHKPTRKTPFGLVPAAAPRAPGRPLALIAVAAALALPAACAPPPTAGTAHATAEPARYLAAHYLDPAQVARVSRFRSGAGYDFSDDAESCRSMKHYLVPRAGLRAEDLILRAPADGRIDALDPEWAGTKVTLAPIAAPDERIVLFHVAVRPGLAVGQRVSAGDVLGHHATLATWSDVALELRAGGGYRLGSIFERLPDALWADWQARGIASRSQLIIPRAERDAHPLACQRRHGPFAVPDGPGDWVVLEGS